VTNRERINRLREAQRGICAGCGQHVEKGPEKRRRKKSRRQEEGSFDHVIPHSAGGFRALDNGLFKHRRCNSARGNAPANGCDLIWHFLTLSRLGLARHERVPTHLPQRPPVPSWAAGPED
jgi:hypothetical protein